MTTTIRTMDNRNMYQREELLEATIEALRRRIAELEAQLTLKGHLENEGNKEP